MVATASTASTASIPALSPARALRPPRRLDLRAGVGILLLFAAIAGNIGFWLASSDSRDVLVAIRDLPAGAQLSATDLAVARVRLDDSLYEAVVPASERSSVIGRQLAAPAHAHQLLGRTHVSGQSPLAPGQLALTIPISAETAGGRIRPGAQVQVLVTTSKGKPDSRTQVVLPRATVYDVDWDERATVLHTSSSSGEASAGSAGGRGSLTSLTLVVTQEEALELAHARWNGELAIALLSPTAAPTQPSR